MPLAIADICIVPQLRDAVALIKQQPRLAAPDLHRHKVIAVGVAGVVGQHGVLGHGLDGQGERGASAGDPGGERDEGVRADVADGLRGAGLKLLCALPLDVGEGRLLPRGHGLLGRRHHINVVEVNIFKAPAEIFLVPKENLIEVSHAANKHTKMDVQLVKSSR